MLVGRGYEQQRIDVLLSGARERASATLVLVGEAGIGKTALLEHAAASAAGFQILRARGVQTEAELPFAALLELCRPILDQLERLEPRQADALRTAFGLADEPTVTPLLNLLRPDVHCKGTDYTMETVPERETVRAYGGRIAIVGDPKDHSTRQLLARVRSQGPGVRSQESGISRDQGSGIRNQGSGIRDRGSGIGDRGSGIGDRE